jgi:hypothetical protein
MTWADFTVLGLLAAADLALLAYLRRRRGRQATEERMMLCLTLAIGRANREVPGPRRRLVAEVA